jgi:hypothetical protein
MAESNKSNQTEINDLLGGSSATKGATTEAAKIEAAKIEAAQSGRPKPKYLPPVKERHLFHVELDKTIFDIKNGKKLSKAYNQKFTTSDWNAFLKYGKGLGFTVKIMWDPIKYRS